MPTRKPQILQSTWEDVAEIANCLVHVSGERAAEKTTDAILDTIELLGTMPYLGSLHHDPVLQRLGYRKLVCGAYVCVYRMVDGVPMVHRVYNEWQAYSWRLG